MLRQRARSQEAKAERRLALLDATRTLLLEGGSVDRLRIEQVAQRAGLAKGSVYGYFASKEALLVALFDDTFAAWVDALATRPLPDAPTRHAAVVRAFMDSLEAVPNLPLLLRVLFSALEPHAGHDALVQSKRNLLAQLHRLSRWLGAALGLRDDEAFGLLRELLVVFVGMAQISGPRPAVRTALSEPDLAALRMPVAELLPDVLLHVLLGWERR